MATCLRAVEPAEAALRNGAIIYLLTRQHVNGIFCRTMFRHEKVPPLRWFDLYPVMSHVAGCLSDTSGVWHDYIEAACIDYRQSQSSLSFSIWVREPKYKYRAHDSPRNKLLSVHKLLSKSQRALCLPNVKYLRIILKLRSHYS